MIRSFDCNFGFTTHDHLGFVCFDCDCECQPSASACLSYQVTYFGVYSTMLYLHLGYKIVFLLIQASLILKHVTGFMRLLVVNPADENSKRTSNIEGGDFKADRGLSPNSQAEGNCSISEVILRMKY